MQDEKVVKITLTGKISYSDDITVMQAAQIVALIEDAGGTYQPVVPRGGGGLLGGGDRGHLTEGPTLNRGGQSPRDALDSSGAKTNPERIVALAVHLHATDGADTVLPDDIKGLFKRTREATPKNFSRDLGEAVRVGWLDGNDADGYYVTRKAQDVLEEGFESLRASRAASRSSGNRGGSTRPSSTPEAFAGIDEIDGELPGVISYHRVKKRTEKVLWALAKAKELGVASITGKDLSWLTDRLGDGIAVSDMTANYRSLNKSGLVNKSLQTKQMRITPAGEERLKKLSTE
ncbi:hypothetical protein E0H73_40065 [Kribbella pittospori]|uniref:Uncharacterized protein n=1 Tax=Kribbella pittospori TaxID=722689 RepID=A0A4R0KA47_9ACTN|nr:hypothetical protein [Kribbella pittospori]TCC52135.1 hypothetical protein E0H73_40065 [Kribbella pittospori]